MTYESKRFIHNQIQIWIIDLVWKWHTVHSIPKNDKHFFGSQQCVDLFSFVMECLSITYLCDAPKLTHINVVVALIYMIGMGRLAAVSMKICSTFIYYWSFSWASVIWAEKWCRTNLTAVREPQITRFWRMPNIPNVSQSKLKSHQPKPGLSVISNCSKSKLEEKRRKQWESEPFSI